MIHTFTKIATLQQLSEMLEVYPTMIKIVVDIRRNILSGGGEMHADCESALLTLGCEQDDIWGANWYPAEGRIEFESLINIRPRMGNRSLVIQSESVRRLVESVARALLEEAK